MTFVGEISNLVANIVMGTLPSNPVDMRALSLVEVGRLEKMLIPGRLNIALGPRPTMPLEQWDDLRAKFPPPTQKERGE